MGHCGVGANQTGAHDATSATHRSTCSEGVDSSQKPRSERTDKGSRGSAVEEQRG